MRIKLAVFLATMLLLSCAPMAGAGMMYMNTLTGGVSTLYTLTTGAVAAEVGVIQFNGGNLSIRDIAFDSITGKMFAITANHLYYLDFQHPVAGVVTAHDVGATTGAAGLQGLAVGGDGTIYAGRAKTASASGNLYTLNGSSGAATLKGSFGVGGGAAGDYLGDYGDLAQGPDGGLYGLFAWQNHAGNNYLGAVNLSSGAVTPKTSGTGRTGADGLVFIGNTIYAVRHAGGLMTLDFATGAKLTDILIKDSQGNTINNGYGLAFVPLPPSVMLLGSGLLGLGLFGFRRRRHGG